MLRLVLDLKRLKEHWTENIIAEMEGQISKLEVGAPTSDTSIGQTAKILVRHGTSWHCMSAAMLVVIVVVNSQDGLVDHELTNAEWNDP